MSSGVWYCATLSDEQIVAGHVDVIRRLFAEAISDPAVPDGACLFATSHDAVFFSPASISAVPHLIAQYHAQPSPPPERARAALLVGEEEDWDLLPRSTH